jgi:hypothetical protein
MVLTLSEGRAVQAFDASGATVFARLAGGHEARGDRLLYDAATGAYTLSGRPAIVKSPDESGSGCQLATGVLVVFKGREWSWQGAMTTKAVGCEVSIR